MTLVVRTIVLVGLSRGVVIIFQLYIFWSHYFIVFHLLKQHNPADARVTYDSSACMKDHREEI